MIAEHPAGSDMQVSVANLPAFVPPNTVAEKAAPLLVSIDADASASLTRELPEFFKAWGASNTVGISRFLDSDPQPNLLAGLGGTATFVGVSEVSVGFPVDTGAGIQSNGLRQTVVNVAWNTAAGGWTQQYRLETYQDDDDKWYITSIEGGGFGITDSKKTTDVASSPSPTES
jgi:hypothetical protein